jgi:hypothetical protein
VVSRLDDERARFGELALTSPDGVLDQLDRSQIPVLDASSPPAMSVQERKPWRSWWNGGDDISSILAHGSVPSERHPDGSGPAESVVVGLRS